jgi:hypothetical protein
MKTKLAIALDLQVQERIRLKKERRRVYRKHYHEKNREKENEKNRQRYHEKYKTDPVWVEKRQKRWREFSAKQIKGWSRARSKKYRKPYKELSESTRSKIRAAYTVWAKNNWDERVKYARQYRRKKPTFGLRSQIARARASGEFGELAEKCLDAIIRSYEVGRKR